MNDSEDSAVGNKSVYSLLDLSMIQRNGFHYDRITVYTSVWGFSLLREVLLIFPFFLALVTILVL